jgi:hypothetical protein
MLRIRSSLGGAFVATGGLDAERVADGCLLAAFGFGPGGPARPGSDAGSFTGTVPASGPS